VVVVVDEEEDEVCFQVWFEWKLCFGSAPLRNLK
jgi:hypothetical protein